MSRGRSLAFEIAAAARMMGDGDEQRQPSRREHSPGRPRLGNPRSSQSSSRQRMSRRAHPDSTSSGRAPARRCHVSILQELFDVASEKAEETKRRDRERKKQRYAEDSEYREKIKARNRARHLKNKEARNARRRQRRKPNREFTLKRHGMSLAEYAARLADQGGVCVICLKAREKVLCVDHDHRTKKLRSLLCDSCNLGLGHYNDDAAAMRRAADYLEYWQWRHADPCNTGPPPFAACNQQGSFAPSLPSIQSPPLTGEDMTPADETTEEGKASRMMRRAILHELLQPFDPDPLPPVHMLQAVSRAIVVKAAQGDMTAAREILDRIDGKTATAPAAPETPNEVVFTWQRR
jgi:hypothetical protein